MNNSGTIEYLLIIEAILEFVLFLLVLKQSRTLENKIYLWFIVGVIGWVSGIAFFRLSTILILTHLWAIFYYISAALIATTLFQFSFLFPKRRTIFTKTFFLSSFLPLIFFIFAINTKYFIKDIALGTTNIVSLGILYNFYGLWFISYFLVAFVNLFRNYLISSGAVKLQLKYFLLGTLFSGVVGVFFNLLLPWVGNYELIWIGPIFSIIWLAFITYAITRHRLMDIRFIIRKFVFYFGLGIFIFIAYYIVAWVDENMFGGQYTIGALLSALVMAPLFLLGFFYTARALRRIANKYFFTSLYDYQETMNNFARSISATLNLNEVVNVIVDTIKKTMWVDNIAVLVGEGAYRPVRVEGFQASDLLHIANKPSCRNIISSLKRPLVYDELLVPSKETSLSPENINYAKEQMFRLSIAVVLPLMAKGNLIA